MSEDKLNWTDTRTDTQTLFVTFSGISSPSYGARILAANVNRATRMKFRDIFHGVFDRMPFCQDIGYNVSKGYYSKLGEEQKKELRVLVSFFLTWPNFNWSSRLPLLHFQCSRMLALASDSP